LRQLGTPVPFPACGRAGTQAGHGRRRDGCSVMLDAIVILAARAVIEDLAGGGIGATG
jgi:hypothetical protein